MTEIKHHGKRRRVYADGRVSFIGWVAYEADDYGKRQRTERAFPQMRERDAWLSRLLAEDHQARGKGHGPTVGDLLEAWYSHGEAVDWAPRTRANARYVIDKHLGHIGALAVERLAVKHVEDLIAGMVKAEVSPHLIRQARNALSAALNLAMKRKTITPRPNVVRLVDIPSVQRRLPRVIGPQHLAKFLKAIEADELGPLYHVAALLALRPGEALGLKWEDVDLDVGTVTVRRSVQPLRGTRRTVERPTKTGQERTIALPTETAALLAQHHEAQRTQRITPWVFTNGDGKPLHGPYVTRHLRELMAGAGIPALPMYGLRHTGATLRLVAGSPTKTVQYVMGHATTAQTARYQQVVDSLQRDDADAMDALLRAAGGNGGRVADA